MKKYVRIYAFLFSIAGVIIALDQWTKTLVRENVPFGGVWSPWEWLAPYARIVHWQNTGAAFGIFQGYNPVFMGLAILVSIAIIYYFPQISEKDWPLRLALSMQLGGAVGNLIDRITIGQVTDFVSVGSFAVFNVADSCITVGVVILLIGIWIKDRQDKKTAPVEQDPGE
ncbi:MAG TPA: signal peptidase II [Anaerolineaceae bacterium]|nr:signal peptidase II [Anaerolineaceae bacterium]